MEFVVKLEVGAWEVVVVRSISGLFLFMLGLAGWPSKVVFMFLDVVARLRKEKVLLSFKTKPSESAVPPVNMTSCVSGG